MNIGLAKIKLPGKRGLALLLAAAAVLVLLAAYLHRNGAGGRTFRTVEVRRGNLLATISATGTVEPEEVIDIGAQVTGKIVSFGKDKHGKPVDYGSVVEAGEVLARIDDALYAADAEAATAQLGQSKAALQRAQADLGQLKAKLFQAQRDWARAQKLGPSDALSQADYDAAQSAYETAKANVEVGKAAIVQAKRTVEQSKAALDRAKQNLSYCTIQSPVRGVVVDRRVNIGQTVVSSLSASSLFLLAKDLTRMQIWVSVNEADIGQIKPGQPVTFTIDAYPGETFRGEVGKVRLNATMTQNVVTYTVEVNTDNSSGKLLPYLTANVKFIVGERKNVLLVPNAALRWMPPQDQVAAGFQGKTAKVRRSETTSQGKPVAEATNSHKAQGTLWLPEGSLVRPLAVAIGLNDGVMTEVEGPGLRDKMQVVVGEVEKQASGGKPAGGASPFVPQPLRKGSNPPPPPAH